MAATEARKKGTSKDDVDYRGRWKNKRQQDVYVSRQLDWPSVNCASRLYFGGPCRYIVKQEAALSDEWLCQHVTPSITCSFGHKIRGMLARPLLWAVFHPTQSERVNPSIRQRIAAAFIRLERPGFAEVTDNPVKRVNVVASEGV